MKKYGKTGRPGKRRRNMPGYRLGVDKIGRKAWLVNRRPEDIEGHVSKKDFLDGKIEPGSIFAISKKSNGVFLGIHRGRILYYNPKTDRVAHTGFGRGDQVSRRIMLLKEKAGLDYFQSENNWMNHRKVPGSDMKVSDVLLNPYRKTIVKNVGDEFTMLDYHETAVVGDVLKGFDSGLNAEVLMITKRGMTVKVDDGTVNGRIGHVNLKDARYRDRKYSLTKSAVNSDLNVEDLQNKFKKESYATVKTENDGTVAVSRGRPAGSKNRPRTEEEKQASREKMNKHIEWLDDVSDNDLKEQIKLVKKIISHANKAGDTESYNKYRKTLQQLKYKEGLHEKYYKAQTDEETLTAAKNALKYERRIGGRDSAIKMWEDRINAFKKAMKTDDPEADLMSATLDLEFEDEKKPENNKKEKIQNPEVKPIQDIGLNKKIEELGNNENKTEKLPKEQKNDNDDSLENKLNQESESYKKSNDKDFEAGFKFASGENYDIIFKLASNYSGIEDRIAELEDFIKTNASSNLASTQQQRRIMFGERQALKEKLKAIESDDDFKQGYDYINGDKVRPLLEKDDNLISQELYFTRTVLDTGVFPDGPTLSKKQKITFSGRYKALKDLINKKESEFQNKLNQDLEKEKENVNFVGGYTAAKLELLTGGDKTLNKNSLEGEIEEIITSLKNPETAFTGDADSKEKSINKFLGRYKAVKEILDDIDSPDKIEKRVNDFKKVLEELDNKAELYKEDDSFKKGYKDGLTVKWSDKTLEKQIKEDEYLLISGLNELGKKLSASEEKFFIGRRQGFKELLKKSKDAKVSPELEEKLNKESVDYTIANDDDFMRGYENIIEGILPVPKDSDGIKNRISEINEILISNKTPLGTKLTEFKRKMFLGERKALQEKLENKIKEDLEKELDKYKDDEKFKLGYNAINNDRGYYLGGDKNQNEVNIKNQLEIVKKVLTTGLKPNGDKLTEDSRKTFLGQYKALKEFMTSVDKLQKEGEANFDEEAKSYLDGANSWFNSGRTKMAMDNESKVFSLTDIKREIKKIEESLKTDKKINGVGSLKEVDRAFYLGERFYLKELLKPIEKDEAEWNSAASITPEEIEKNKKYQKFDEEFEEIIKNPIQYSNPAEKAKKMYSKTIHDDFANSRGVSLKSSIKEIENELDKLIEDLNKPTPKNQYSDEYTQRVRHLANYIGLRDGLVRKKRSVERNFIAKGRELSASDVSSINNSRVNGFALKTDSFMIEDQQILMWQEKNIDGKNQTGAWFKVTNEGFDLIRNILDRPDSPFQAVDRTYLDSKRISEKTSKVTVGNSKQKDSNGNEINFGKTHEAEIDGVKIRIWDQGPGTLFSAKNNIEVIAPGDDKEAANKVMQAINKLGLEVSESTKDDRELLYLIKILKQRNELRHLETFDGYKKLVYSDNPEDRKKAIALLSKKLSENLGIEDVTKLPKYNPDPVSTHFDGTGNLTTYRPDLELDPKWNEFKENHLLYHNPFYNASDRTGSFAKRVEKLIKASKGNFVSALDRMRRGFVTEAGATDMKTGGGVYVYAGVINKNTSAERRGFYWKPEIIARTDSISFDRDQFGRQVSKESENYGIVADYTDKIRISGMKNIINKCAPRPSNETLFKNTLSLNDLDKIVVHANEKDEVIKLFKDAGMELLPDGRKVEDIIKVTYSYY